MVSAQGKGLSMPTTRGRGSLKETSGVTHTQPYPAARIYKSIVMRNPAPLTKDRKKRADLWQEAFPSSLHGQKPDTLWSEWLYYGPKPGQSFSAQWFFSLSKSRQNVKRQHVLWYTNSVLLWHKPLPEESVSSRYESVGRPLCQTAPVSL